VGRGGRAPKWVRRVPLVAERSKLSLILIDVLDVDPRDAASTPWARAWRLSPRLARVAALAMQGLSDEEIAAVTKLSFASVRTYMRDVMQHAEVDNRVLLLRAALSCDLKTRGT
jgi:DNA-binding NarL/FixJ family response regulator